MVRAVQLREILGCLGFCLPDWPQNIESHLAQDIIQNGEAHVEVWSAWKAALLGEAPGTQGLVLDLLDNLITHKKQDS